MIWWDRRRRLLVVYYVIISISTLAICLRFIYDLSVKDSAYVTDAFTREQQYRNGWWEHDDPDFIRYIKHQWLVDPSESAFIGETTLRDFEKNSKKYDTSQFGQSLFVDKHLGKVENGFFVECGAADGKRFSNTFFFEKVRNWTGLLIEANPMLFREMSLLSRAAYMINVCLSTTASSQQMEFLTAGLMGGLKGKVDNRYVLIECAKQYTLRNTFLGAFQKQLQARKSWSSQIFTSQQTTCSGLILVLRSAN